MHRKRQDICPLSCERNIACPTKPGDVGDLRIAQLPIDITLFCDPRKIDALKIFQIYQACGRDVVRDEAVGGMTKEEVMITYFTRRDIPPRLLIGGKV